MWFEIDRVFGSTVDIIVSATFANLEKTCASILLAIRKQLQANQCGHSSAIRGKNWSWVIRTLAFVIE